MRAAFLAYIPRFACTGATVSATDHRGLDVWPLNQLLHEFRL
jgi:hypothetical protein